jgi:hypothetical protein
MRHLLTPSLYRRVMAEVLADARRARVEAARVAKLTPMQRWWRARVEAARVAKLTPMQLGGFGSKETPIGRVSIPHQVGR